MIEETDPERTKRNWLIGIRRCVLATRIAVCAAVTWWTLWGPVVLAATDSDQLRALHEKVIQAHLKNDVELLLEDEAADYVVAGRGEVTRPTLAERRARLGPYLQRTTFHEYRDLQEPIVKVSQDGAMGFVVVQVRASGTQVDGKGGTHSLLFTSAWIELYEKREGRWYRTGNVSNFKE